MLLCQGNLCDESESQHTHRMWFPRRQSLSFQKHVGCECSWICVWNFPNNVFKLNQTYKCVYFTFFHLLYFLSFYVTGESFLSPLFVQQWLKNNRPQHGCKRTAWFVTCFSLQTKSKCAEWGLLLVIWMTPVSFSSTADRSLLTWNQESNCKWMSAVKNYNSNQSLRLRFNGDGGMRLYAFMILPLKRSAPTNDLEK